MDPTIFSIPPVAPLHTPHVYFLSFVEQLRRLQPWPESCADPPCHRLLAPGCLASAEFLVLRSLIIFLRYGWRATKTLFINIFSLMLFIWMNSASVQNWKILLSHIHWWIGKIPFVGGITNLEGLQIPRDYKSRGITNPKGLQIPRDYKSQRMELFRPDGWFVLSARMNSTRTHVRASWLVLNSRCLPSPPGSL